MPSAFVSLCPHCEARLKLKDPALIGKTARCPSCQEKFTVKKAVSIAAKTTSAKKGNPTRRPKPTPVSEPADELDPWLNDDLSEFDDTEGGESRSPTGSIAPPPVQGVTKKRKKSSADKGSQKRKGTSVGVDQVAWMGWLVGGSIAGVIGASVWGAIAAFTFSEWAILAWIIGGFVGFGVRVGAREEDVGLAPGLTALGIALASVVLGKFLAVHFLTARMEDMIADLGAGGEQVAASEDETIEWILDDYAMDVEYEWEEQGREFTSPDWETLPEDSPNSAFYDSEVWAEAERRWNAKSAEEQAAEILAYESEDVNLGILEGEMFKASFSLLDILFFLLACGTAFKVGSGLDFGDD